MRSFFREDRDGSRGSRQEPNKHQRGVYGVFFAVVVCNSEDCSDNFDPGVERRWEGQNAIRCRSHWPHFVEVMLQDGQLRSIPASDFKRLHAIWHAYLSGNLKRVNLRERSQNSTYIISLFHHIGM